jgi:Methyltransferase domain
MAESIICPLCNSTEFSDFKGRGAIKCDSCGSLPRLRIAWLLLKDYAKLASGARVAHFAPEPVLAQKLKKICGDGYEAYDLDPPRYEKRISFARIRKCDLCTDLDRFQPSSYDAIVHNHVMEHVPCNYVMVLHKLQSLLKPGGFHVFSVPVSKGHTKSDLTPGLSASTRIKEFGQSDHLVKFGAADHDMNLGMVFGQTNETYRLEDLLGERALVNANIPKAQWRPSGSTVFVVRRI